MDQNIKLPDFNGKPYSTRQLGRDLSSYSYLRGGVQEAIEYVKYTSVEYLNNLPFGKIVRGWDERYNPGVFRRLLGISSNPNQISTYTRQYLQSEPQRLLKIDPDTQIINPSYNGKAAGKLSQLTSFELDGRGMDSTQLAKLPKAKLVTIYNRNIKKGLKKFQVYEKVGDRYQRISTLGVFGMPEFVIGQDIVRSLVNDYYKTPKPQSSIEQKQEKLNYDYYDIQNSTLDNVFGKIIKHNFQKNKGLKGIAKILRQYIPNVPIEVISFRERFNKTNAAGVYVLKENKIYIDKKFLLKSTSTPEVVATAIVHESIHAALRKYLRQYVTDEGHLKFAKVPIEVSRLMFLYNEAKRRYEKETDIVRRKFDDNKELTDTEKFFYGLKDVNEFTTFMMTEPDFQNKLNVKYKKTATTIPDKFYKIVTSIINSIGSDIEEDTITFDTIKAILQLSDHIKNTDINAEKSMYQKMNESNIAAEELLNQGFEDGIVPDINRDEENISNSSPTYDARKNNSTFEELFKCE